MQICERWILAPLRNHTLVGLAEANREVARLLEVLNDRPFQKLPGTRRSRFEELDRPELAPLPSVPYAYAEWKKARVNIDYHVEVDRHYYSVPHPLMRKQVDARLTAKTLEILLGGKRVAAHIRSYRVGGCYFRLGRLLTELALARADGSYTKMLEKLAKAELLILDDWGLAPLADAERRDLLEILEDRYRSRAAVVTSQLPIEHWHEYIGNPTLADAILDRLVHGAHKIILKGGSMRKRLAATETDSPPA